MYPKFRERALNNWPRFTASKLGLSRDYLTALENTSAQLVSKRRGQFVLSIECCLEGTDGSQMELTVFYSDLQGGSEYIRVLYTYPVNTPFGCPGRGKHPSVPSSPAWRLLRARLQRRGVTGITEYHQQPAPRQRAPMPAPDRV